MLQICKDQLFEDTGTTDDAFTEYEASFNQTCLLSHKDDPLQSHLAVSDLNCEGTKSVQGVLGRRSLDRKFGI